MIINIITKFWNVSLGKEIGTVSKINYYIFDNKRYIANSRLIV